MLSLPAVNASFNATSTVFLLTGYFLIRRKKVFLHRVSMSLAFLSSTAFLACYVYYHLQVGSVRFQGTGWIRPVYFGMLISHVLLAAAILPMAMITLTRALRGQFERHRAIARWTLPIWLYVSVTGVLIYFMLYHWFASSQSSIQFLKDPGAIAL